VQEAMKRVEHAALPVLKTTRRLLSEKASVSR